MIDFRYHLVSIIAIFFALAAGIVLGAGPLGDRADENLSDQLASMRDENRTLREERDEFEIDLEVQKRFIDEVSPRLVDGELLGQHVALITLPGSADDQIDAIQNTLEEAGAVADLRLRIEPSWADAESDALLDDLANEYVSSGVSLDEEADGYTRGAAVLVSAFLATTDEEAVGPPTLEPLNTDIISAFEDAGLVRLEDESSSRASLAVVVAGDISGDDAGERVERLVPVASEADAAGDGTVATGPGSTATESGVLSVIRGSDAGDDVSTVDTVTRASGRVAVVFALGEQENGGVGHYGLEGDTDGLIPPAPDESDSENGDGESGDEGGGE